MAFTQTKVILYENDYIRNYMVPDQTDVLSKLKQTHILELGDIRLDKFDNTSETD